MSNKFVHYTHIEFCTLSTIIINTSLRGRGLSLCFADVMICFTSYALEGEHRRQSLYMVSVTSLGIYL